MIEKNCKQSLVEHNSVNYHAPFVFISYSHEDKKDLDEICSLLKDNGIDYWYDDQIHSGSDWNSIIARKIEDSSACLFLLSSHSVAPSSYVKKELEFSINCDKSIHALFLESISIPGNFRLMLSGIQYVSKDDRYQERLIHAIKDDITLSESTTASPRQGAGFSTPIINTPNSLKDHSAHTKRVKRYSLIAIYSPVIVWLLWALTIGFDGFIHYTICTILSIFLYLLISFVLPPHKKPKTQERDHIIIPDGSVDNWGDLVSLIKQQLRVFQRTPLNAPLNTLCINAMQIEVAIKADPGKENTSSVREFKNLYPMLTPQLKKYREISENHHPGQSAIEFMSTVEQEITYFSEACQRMLDNIYEYDVMELRSHFGVMKQKLDVFEQVSTFKL